MIGLGLNFGLGLGGGGGGSPFSAYPALAAAVAAGRGKILFISDSKGMGQGSGSGGYLNNGGAYALTPAAIARADLNAAGRTAIDGFVGAQWNASDTIANHFLYDPRVTSADTTNYSVVNLYYASAFADSVGTSPFVFTPGFTYDRVEAMYLRNPGNGTFTVKQGAATLITGNQSGGPDMQTQTVSVAASSTALSIARSSGACYLPYVRVWNSATPHVCITQLGVSGRTTAGAITSAAAWDPLNTLASLDPDLAIIELGANDMNTGVAAATFKANLQTLITTLVALSCNVQLVATTRAGDAAAAFDISAAYMTALSDLITTNSLPPLIDLYTLSSPYNAANYVDGVHRTAAYQATVGHAISARLLA